LEILALGDTGFHKRRAAVRAGTLHSSQDASGAPVDVGEGSVALALLSLIHLSDRKHRAPSLVAQFTRRLFFHRVEKLGNHRKGRRDGVADRLLGVRIGGVLNISADAIQIPQRFHVDFDTEVLKTGPILVKSPVFLPSAPGSTPSRPFGLSFRRAASMTS